MGQQTNFLELTKNAIAETLGSPYMDSDNNGEVFTLSADKLVEVGKDITDNSATLEKFTNALCQLIYKIDIDVRTYKSELVSMFVDSTEYGQWLERIKFDFNTIIDDPMYNLVPDRDYSSIEHKFYQPKVRAKMFTESKSIAIPISIQLDEVKTAFHGEAEMNNFVAGIRQQIVNQTKMILDTYAHITASCGIALSVGPMQTAVHLITEAIAKGILNSGATRDDAMNSPEFMRYATERIANLYNYFRRPSSSFNNKSCVTWSDKVNLALLSDFANANIFRNQSITFNEQLVRFPEYDSVVAWQAHKEDFSTGGDVTEFTLDSLATVAVDDEDNKLGLKPYYYVDPESEEPTDYMLIKNCVGLLYDYKALGVTMFNNGGTTSSYTASTNMTNSFTHIKLNSMIDTDYNIVAILLD